MNNQTQVKGFGHKIFLILLGFQIVVSGLMFYLVASFDKPTYGLDLPFGGFYFTRYFLVVYVLSMFSLIIKSKTGFIAKSGLIATQLVGVLSLILLWGLGVGSYNKGNVIFGVIYYLSILANILMIIIAHKIRKEIPKVSQ